MNQNTFQTLKCERMKVTLSGSREHSSCIMSCEFWWKEWCMRPFEIKRNTALKKILTVLLSTSLLTLPMAGNATQLLRGQIMSRLSLYASTRIGRILRTSGILISYHNLGVLERAIRSRKCLRYTRLRSLIKSFRIYCFLLRELEFYNFWEKITWITKFYLSCMSRVALELFILTTKIVT